MKDGGKARVPKCPGWKRAWKTDRTGHDDGPLSTTPQEVDTNKQNMADRSKHPRLDGPGAEGEPAKFFQHGTGGHVTSADLNARD